jgi:starch synthase
MKILITAGSFCEYVISQANALAYKGHTVLIMLPKKLVNATVGDALSELLTDGVACYCYDTKKRKSITLYAEIRKTVSKFKPDIIHIHENSDFETLFLLLWYHHIPSMLTVHDVTAHPGFDQKLSFRRKVVKKILRNYTSCIHVHGDFLQKELEKLKKSWFHKSIIIPHGSLTIFKHWRKKRIPREKQTCLFFGRMEKYKGVDNVYRVGQELKCRGKEFKIIVAGQGTELDQYKEKMLTAGVFEIHDGFIENREVYKYFERASLLLLPYHEASQSGVAAMALAFGLPIVAMSVGSIPDIIVDNKHGILIANNDLDGFIKAVNSLLTHEFHLERMRRECKKLSHALNFNQLAEYYEHEYLSLKKD